MKTLSLIPWVKLPSPFSQHARDQKVCAYNHSFIIIIQSLGCKEILITLYHEKKISDAVLLCVFNIGLPASLFTSSLQSTVPINDQGPRPGSCTASLLHLLHLLHLDTLKCPPGHPHITVSTRPPTGPHPHLTAIILNTRRCCPLRVLTSSFGRSLFGLRPRPYV